MGNTADKVSDEDRKLIYKRVKLTDARAQFAKPGIEVKLCAYFYDNANANCNYFDNFDEFKCKSKCKTTINPYPISTNFTFQQTYFFLPEPGVYDRYFSKCAVIELFPAGKNGDNNIELKGCVHSGSGAGSVADLELIYLLGVQIVAKTVNPEYFIGLDRQQYELLYDTQISTEMRITNKL